VKTTYSPKRILSYGVAGLVVAVLMIAVLVNPLLSPVQAKTGTLVVKVMDAPVPDLQHLNLTINSVQVSNETGDWVNLPISGGSLYFDLLVLQDVTKDLAIGSIPMGNYTKIRIQIVTANATLSDGTTITLNVPPRHVDIQIRFEIEPGKTTSLIIEIVVDKIQIAERGSSGNPANLNPQFKAITVPPT
jgi:hypothetical protein